MTQNFLILTFYQGMLKYFNPSTSFLFKGCDKTNFWVLFQGKLLYCQAPPGVSEETFCPVCMPAKTGMKRHMEMERAGTASGNTKVGCH